MASRAEQISAILDRLITQNTNDVAGATVASSDGMLLGSRVAADVNADRVAAIAATMMGVSSRVVNDLKIGKPEEAIVRAGEGYLLILPVNGSIVLAMMLRGAANLGMVRLEAREASNAIAQAMTA